MAVIGALFGGGELRDALFVGGISPSMTLEPTESKPRDNTGRSSVSVITRTKYRPLLLARTAESLARQSFTDFHWVVVNDGGDAVELRQVLDSSGMSGRHVTVISNPESVGMEAAANIGVRATTSDLVALLDDDDTWEPEFLATTVAFLTSDDGARYGGVVTRSTYVSEEIRDDAVVEVDRWPYDPWLETVHVLELAGRNLFPVNSFLYRRDVFDSIGGYDASLPVLGDWDFNLRFLQQADVAVVPIALSNYHHRSTSGDPSYGNTVFDQREIHQEYATLIRNRMMRGADTGAVLASLGYVLEELRGEIRRGGLLPVDTSGPDGEHGAGGDDYWVALTALAHGGSLLNRRSKLVRVIRGALRKIGIDIGVVRTDVADLMAEAVDAIELFDVPVPPDFDEPAYLARHPDVAEAVRTGSFAHGYHHFLAQGRREGRARPIPGSAEVAQSSDGS